MNDDEMYRQHVDDLFAEACGRPDAATILAVGVHVADPNESVVGDHNCWSITEPERPAEQRPCLDP